MSCRAPCASGGWRRDRAPRWRRVRASAPRRWRKRSGAGRRRSRGGEERRLRTAARSCARSRRGSGHRARSRRAAGDTSTRPSRRAVSRSRDAWPGSLRCRRAGVPRRRSNVRDASAEVPPRCVYRAGSRRRRLRAGRQRPAGAAARARGPGTGSRRRRRSGSAPGRGGRRRGGARPANRSVAAECGDGGAAPLPAPRRAGEARAMWRSQRASRRSFAPPAPRAPPEPCRRDP